MGSGAVIYVPSFLKIGSSIQKLIRGIYTHRQQRDLISLLNFLKIKSRLMIFSIFSGDLITIIRSYILPWALVSTYNNLLQ
jgi:hypothetical protein